ncbi:hypothetical protein FA95DRAFT_1606231 [Auriscalpium vulgare]|uniref:Uncharacterized protein n=1 Tax=Auriscalpium vulgare TaxID=40419 RepID=A0ACB8RUD8_9AGAM|nr:hypothetical protein FA95DRAFT_1606231 [Auriscalpium vulgare]
MMQTTGGAGDGAPDDGSGGGEPDDDESSEDPSSGSEEAQPEHQICRSGQEDRSEATPPDLQIWDELNEMWQGEQVQIDELREAGRTVLERASAAERRMMQSRERYGSLLARIGLPRPDGAKHERQESNDGVLARATRNLSAPRGADEDSPQYRRRRAAARRMSTDGERPDRARTPQSTPRLGSANLGPAFSPRSRNILQNWREQDMQENGFSNIPSMSRHGSDGTPHRSDASRGGRRRGGAQSTGDRNSGRGGGGAPPPPSPDGSSGEDPSGEDEGSDASPPRRATAGRGRKESPSSGSDSSDSDELNLDEEYDRRGDSSRPTAPSGAHRRSSAPKSGRRARAHDKARSHEHDALQAYRMLVEEKVGKDLSHLPDIKGIKQGTMDTYSGEDNISIYDGWLMVILRTLNMSRVCGPQRNQDQITVLGNTLKGPAAIWFNAEVEHPKRAVRHWKFVDVVCALYHQFIHEATAQNTSELFDTARFSRVKGIVAYFNELMSYAARMVERPSKYTFKQRFLKGLPHDFVEKLIINHGISAEF